MSTPRLELLYVPGCPSLTSVRAMTEDCLRQVGIDAVVHEREGAFASPTLLIDGVDVVTGAPAQTPGSCRLDLPSRDRILAALKTATS